jgi:hypothetical protein
LFSTGSKGEHNFAQRVGGVPDRLVGHLGQGVGLGPAGSPDRPVGQPETVGSEPHPAAARVGRIHLAYDQAGVLQALHDVADAAGGEGERLGQLVRLVAVGLAAAAERRQHVELGIGEAELVELDLRGAPQESGEQTDPLRQLDRVGDVRRLRAQGRQLHVHFVLLHVGSLRASPDSFSKSFWLSFRHD